MLDACVRLGGEVGSERELLAEIADYVARVMASAGQGDTGVVGRAEAAVQADPGVLRFDADGAATLCLEGRTWQAGRFETVSIGGLRERARERQKVVRPGHAPRVRFWC
ncbi:MAG: hypothetical protein R3F14_27955 [Polyangiaceae bacterium]